MRKYVLIVLSLITVGAEAQTYYPFPTDSAYWSVESGFWGMFGYECTGTAHYAMNGDTIIDNMTYSKIYESYGNQHIFEPQDAMYLCALREDSLKRIYVQKLADSVDLLLYDFSANLNDTIYPDNFFTGDPYSGVVTSVDSVLIDSVYRRQLNIYTGELQYWVEGMGNTYGLFQMIFTGNMSSATICFTYNTSDSIIPVLCHCGPFNNVGEEMGENDMLYVFPNPSSEHSTLNIKGIPHGNCNLKVLDLTGRLLLTKSINSNDDLDIYLSKGVYFFQIETEDRIIRTGKIVRT